MDPSSPAAASATPESSPSGPPRFWPAIPERLEDTGIPRSVLVDLVLRYVREHGTATLASLRKALKLSYPVLEALFHQLRQQLLLDVKGMVEGDYTFSLTSSGRELAADRSEVCRYAAATPVPLAQFCAAVQAQSAQLALNRETLATAFADLVVTDALLDQLGPALISQKSLFLYGPTGNGKTSIAERLLRTYNDAVFLPYAVEVDGHIISYFDPLVHRPVDPQPDPDTVDGRWILCQRPCIIVGGELVQSMLELRLDESSGVYAAPLQMKANNGLLVIDDFGRQALSPRDLLNRWIVPLDRRVDFLSLRYGMTFQIPFELMVVFSTNLDPAQLADEAFLRRLQNKIYIQPVQPGDFDTIFDRVAAERNLTCEPGMAAYLRGICEQRGSTGLRACYPLDIFNLLVWISQYERQPLAVNRQTLDRAAELYFTRTQEVTDI